MLEQRIQQHFIDSADLKYQAAQTLSKPIAQAVQAVLACVTSGGKVLACGNGGSAADAQHFSAEFVGRYEREMSVVALTGRGGGKMAGVLRETDVHICVPHERTARIQEVHILALHCICDGVDAQLLGEQDNPT